MTNSISSNQAVLYLTIDEAADGQRLDNFLISTLKGVPKSHIYRLIRSGQVRVNKGRAKQTQRLALNDLVRIPPVRVAERPELEPGTVIAWQPKFLFQDESLWVINKPAGMAVHGGSGHRLGLIENLRVLYPEERQLELVHRLDRDTSGAIIVARKRSALKQMQRLLQEGGVKRFYWLLCTDFKQKQISISAPLLRQDDLGVRKMIVSKAGKVALTHFSLVASGMDFQLLEAELITGRTHQIRVHAQFGGFPIIGDERYGEVARDKSLADSFKLPTEKLFLHARRLEFRHPVNGERIALTAELDSFFTRALKNVTINFN